MSIIGLQIKKYRTLKGITQEQLGQIIGVTTQAVSKWERGGTPDAELIPSLADALEVSIDTLYGRDEQSTFLTIARKLCYMSQEEAYNFAFRICWASEIGLLQDIDFLNDILSKMLDPDDISVRSDYMSKLMTDSGMVTTRLFRDFRYFFLMKEPKSGIKEQLSDPEELRKVFQIFSNKKLLRIIFYLYSRLNTPIATSLISKNTGIEPDEVDRCMQMLCDVKLATKSFVATENGMIYSYKFHQESSVIPLLCFADEIVRTDSQDFMLQFDRNKPLF